MEPASSSSSLYRQMIKDYVDTSSSDDDVVTSEATCSTLFSKASAVLLSLEKPISRQVYVVRDREAANERLVRDYFSEEPLYSEEVFRRRFRMSKRLFLKICNNLQEKYTYFQQLPDARGKLGFTGLQKCTSAIRVLAYGNSTDINDDYLKMTEKTTRDVMEHFTRGIIDQYGKRYLRKPTWYDLQKIYEVHNQKHRLPGMIGSVDCMHWPWYTCPTAWRGQHTSGHKGYPSLILQAVASQDLWIWSAFFGVAGANNDINVIRQSPLVEDIVAGTRATASFWANGNEYPYGYYLGDGIYPEWATIVKTFRDPIDPKRQHFKKVQEGARKDVERAFGVLKKRWSFVQIPCRLWTKDKIRDCMYAAIILHNMILEDEGRAICQDYVENYVEEFTPATPEERFLNEAYMIDRDVHNALTQDLVEHALMFRRTEQQQSDDEDESDEDETERTGENDDDYDDVNDDDD